MLTGSLELGWFLFRGQGWIGWRIARGQERVRFSSMSRVEANQ
jgi:hypothetical protein